MNVFQQKKVSFPCSQAAGCRAWLLDLRDNPGGVVGEGLAVAELLLRPGDVAAFTLGRSGEYQQQLVYVSGVMVGGWEELGGQWASWQGACAWRLGKCA